MVMSLVLLGNARELRFSGEANLVERPEPDPPPDLPLGRPRVRRPRRAQPASQHTAIMCGSPWPEGPWNPSDSEIARRTKWREEHRAAWRTPAKASSEASSAVARSLRRLAKLPERVLARTEEPAKAIPMFRTAELVETELSAAPRERPSQLTRRPSLRAWIAAALFLALVSYQVASHVVGRL
jgi:hypothetical protein